jgi:uncharacterized protein YggU (UPF0235/DUF167 family)
VRPEARLTVQVRPRAALDAVDGWAGAALRVRVTAPPAGGAANEAVRALLARALGCPRADVEIVRGAAARTKLVRVVGLAPEDLRARLGARPPGADRGSVPALSPRPPRAR